jgi:hypothetical protein
MKLPLQWRRQGGTMALQRQNCDSKRMLFLVAQPNGIGLRFSVASSWALRPIRSVARDARRRAKFVGTLFPAEQAEAIPRCEVMFT